MYLYISIIFCEREGILSSNLFNESFISFDLQIGATGIPVCPSFDCQSRLCRLSRHGRQPATLGVFQSMLSKVSALRISTIWEKKGLPENVSVTVSLLNLVARCRGIEGLLFT